MRRASWLSPEKQKISGVAYDEKVLKSGIQHKINAYAIADNYETIDSDH